MGLMLCCLTVGQQKPGMMVPDESTNNPDLQNIKILTAAVNSYRGTLLVLSHDAYFPERIGITHSIALE